MKTRILCFVSILFLLVSCNTASVPVLPVNTYIQSVTINGSSIGTGGKVYGVPIDSAVIHILFSSKIDPTKLDPSKLYITNNVDTGFVILSDTSKSELSFRIKKTLNYYAAYKIELIAGENLGI